MCMYLPLFMLSFATCGGRRTFDFDAVENYVCTLRLILNVVACSLNRVATAQGKQGI